MSNLKDGLMTFVKVAVVVAIIAFASRKWATAKAIFSFS